jgi:S-adenosylmethionine:tRNA ribosyltransferase-isomerase
MVYSRKLSFYTQLHKNMTDPFALGAYDYHLPPELIATHPVSPRDAAKLLVCSDTSLLENGGLHFERKIFHELVDYLNPGDVLVVNTSKVIPARLHGVRGPRDASSPPVNVEFLLHQPKGDFSTWAAFARPAKRLKQGDIVRFKDITAEILGREEDQVILRFNVKPYEVEHFLDEHGEVPLPPYIHRAEEAADKTEYQTVYADAAGSVAAPTAGLHFTPELLQRIKDKGVLVEQVTLHVGAGTFLPVTVDDIRMHKMHAEWGQVSAATAKVIRNAKAAGKTIFAVGTTATRLLETAARATGEIAPWEGSTDIFITPGYRFNVVDCLVTNFHLPKSTLFMLVAAFMGSIDSAQALYREAVAQKYRFYSYGDACLLTRAP